MNTNLYSVAGKRCQPTGCERSVNLSGESSSLGSTCLHGEGAERQALYMTARLAALKPYDMRHTHTHTHTHTQRRTFLHPQTIDMMRGFKPCEAQGGPRGMIGYCRAYARRSDCGVAIDSRRTQHVRADLLRARKPRSRPCRAQRSAPGSIREYEER
jgi:hypothetical protein